VLPWRVRSSKRPDTFRFHGLRWDQRLSNANWKAVIVSRRAIAWALQIMPAVWGFVTEEEINDVIAYMRGFCRNVHHDPLGELNLPRALVTERPSRE